MKLTIMQLIDTLNSHLTLEHEGVTLFDYVYNSKVVPIESPRPYFHPLRTLGGQLVSGFRPHDHRWHHGLSFTSAYLSGQNFWGGPTYVDGAYRQLDNVGSQRDCWGFKDYTEEDAALFSHRILWREKNSNFKLLEDRSLRSLLSPQRDFWCLQWSSTFRGPLPLHWGSPTTQGRENAGYGGLFWRGPREFVDGRILMSEGREGPNCMGQSSPWLAYIGKHDGIDDSSTIIFVDDPQNARYATQWFVRNTAPMVCPSFAFSEEYVQPRGEELRLDYQIIIADGDWSRERIEAEVGNLKPAERRDISEIIAESGDVREMITEYAPFSD